MNVSVADLGPILFIVGLVAIFIAGVLVYAWFRDRERKQANAHAGLKPIPQSDPGFQKIAAFYNHAATNRFDFENVEKKSVGGGDLYSAGV